MEFFGVSCNPVLDRTGPISYNLLYETFPNKSMAQWHVANENPEHGVMEHVLLFVNIIL